MNKKIKILALIFSILVLITTVLLIFLKIDDYVSANIITQNNNSFILLKNNDYKKISNKNKITFILDEHKYTENIDDVFKYDNYIFLKINEIYSKDNFKNINVFIQTKRLISF